MSANPDDIARIRQYFKDVNPTTVKSLEQFWDLVSRLLDGVIDLAVIAPITTGEIVSVLMTVQPSVEESPGREDMSDHERTVFLALMLATAIQRLAGPQ